MGDGGFCVWIVVTGCVEATDSCEASATAADSAVLSTGDAPVDVDGSALETT